jgi:hypothetical protein
MRGPQQALNPAGAHFPSVQIYSPSPSSHGQSEITTQLWYSFEWLVISVLTISTRVYAAGSLCAANISARALV